MTSKRWDQICAVLSSALKQSHSRREQFLLEACGNDEELLHEVSKLLRQNETTLTSLELIDRDAPPGGLGVVFQPDQVVANRYRILRHIARGGMGEVYEARDLDLDRELNQSIALKTLLPEVATDHSMIARFKREIVLSRRIGHSNVCKVYDLASHQLPDGHSVLLLTMEFLPGETLETRLKRVGPMKESESLPLLRQMAAGLAACHENGIVHRDFKPSNVMLVPTVSGERAVVTDFGLARQFHVREDGVTLTASKTIAGTLDYMAPELLTGAAASIASDVYTLGMTAYLMVAGSVPFASLTPLAGAIMRCHRPVPSPRTLAGGLSAAWDSAILTALNPDPNKRFSSPDLFIRALDNAVSWMPQLIPKTAVRRRILGGTAFALLAAAGAVGLGIAWRASRIRLPPEAQILYQKGAEDNSAGAYFAATRSLEEAEKLAPDAPQIHAMLAEAWVALDMPERSAAEMLLVRRENTAGLPRAERLRIEAIDFSITQEYAAAALRYESIVRLRPDDTVAAVDLGRAYENADRPDDAIRSYRRAAEGPQHSPAAWLRLAVLYSRQLKNEKAEEAFGEAERRYRFSSNLEGLTEVTLQRGSAASTAGQFDAAAALLNKALAMAQDQENPQEEIAATLRLSLNAYLAGDVASTERYARQALDAARRHHFDSLAIRGLINVGNAFRRKQDYEQAEQYYRDALNLAGQSHFNHLVALSLISLAALHGDTLQREQAVREAREAMTFYQANRYAKETLQCLTLLARSQRDTGDYEGALKSFRDLLAIAERDTDRGQISLAHEGVGTMLFDLDHLPEALEEYRKAVEFSTDAEHLGYATLDVGNTLWRLGDYTSAEQALARVEAAAQQFPVLGLQLASIRGDMALSRNRFRDAADLSSNALAHGGGRIPELDEDLETTLGLALIGMGQTTEGLAKCEHALAGSQSWQARLERTVALMSARIDAGEFRPALQLFDGIEPRLTTHPELQWRALALAATADRRYKEAARKSLQKLAHLWGKSAYNTYLTRPDVAKLAAPLLL